jgi:hypothetical protein
VSEIGSVADKLSANVTSISSSKYAFAGLKDNGSVVTWGRIINGGNSTAVLNNENTGTWNLTEVSSVASSLTSNVSLIKSNWGAFAALKTNGSVVTWGEFSKGGNASVTNYTNSGSGNWTTSEVKSVANQLTSQINSIYSNSWAFAAIKNNGSVVTWGDLESGGNSTVASARTINGTWTVSEGASVAGQLASGISVIYSNP